MQNSQSEQNQIYYNSIENIAITEGEKTTDSSPLPPFSDVLLLCRYPPNLGHKWGSLKRPPLQVSAMSF
jgi:hypothetical protein